MTGRPPRSTRHDQRPARPRKAKAAGADGVLGDDEGTFLALVQRIGPTTARQLSKIYADSPVNHFGASKSRIARLIGRLAERGLVERSEPESGTTRWISCTSEGENAVRDWVNALSPSHLLLEDPLRSRVQSFDLLTRDEQIAWVLAAKDALTAHLATLGAYERAVTVPHHAQVHDNAVRSMLARIAWLDRMLADLTGGRRERDEAFAAR